MPADLNFVQCWYAIFEQERHYIIHTAHKSDLVFEFWMFFGSLELTVCTVFLLVMKCDLSVQSVSSISTSFAVVMMQVPARCQDIFLLKLKAVTVEWQDEYFPSAHVYRWHLAAVLNSTEHVREHCILYKIAESSLILGYSWRSS